MTRTCNFENRRNFQSNPYKAKQTMEILKFETLYFFWVKTYPYMYMCAEIYTNPIRFPNRCIHHEPKVAPKKLS